MTHIISPLIVCFPMLSVFCFFSDVSLYHHFLIDFFLIEKIRNAYEELVLGVQRTSRYSISVGRGLSLFRFF